jgi:predicted dehydrogenase
VYSDGLAMVHAEGGGLDALFSIVPAYVRRAGHSVEEAAAAKGVHIFSEKPQATEMATAVAIADAIASAGVLSSVGFRERYRPLFQRAKAFLADKTIVHCKFFNGSAQLPPPNPPPPEKEGDWHWDFDKNGGNMFDWGCHAVDYMRFMTGLDVVSAQAFYNHDVQRFNRPTSASFNFALANGATMR